MASGIFAEIEDALKKGEEVAISGFGTFKVVERPGREGRNPQTGDAIKIAPKKSPTFKAGAGPQARRSVELFVDAAVGQQAP